MPRNIGIIKNKKTDKAAEQAAKRAKNTRVGPKLISVSHIRRKVNFLKKKEKK